MNARLPWPDHGLLASPGGPVVRPGLCSLAQPCLQRPQRTPRFMFQAASVVWVASGRLDWDVGTQRGAVQAPGSLLLADAHTTADLLKTPGGEAQRFHSYFLSLAPAVLEGFQRLRPADAGMAAAVAVPPLRQLPLDTDLAAALQAVWQGMGAPGLSDERLQFRLWELLAALAERGHSLRATSPQGTAARLRALIAQAPGEGWTADAVGRALAMSAATLRRRLAGEGVRFEEVLIDVRMHHALMLVQTTSWSLPRIAQACGYQSRARFAERFRARFGYPPSAVR